MLFARSVLAMSATAPKTIPVEIVSDTVCPWCYVGKSRLQTAIDRFRSKPGFEKVKFDVTWKPFRLNPQAPQDDPGRDKMEYYVEKFGEQRTKQMEPQMAKTFEESGLPAYSMAGLTGSTLNSHRLIHWARKQGGAQAQDRLVDELFKGYFTQERYINDADFLAEAAERAGLPAEKARAVIADPNSQLSEVQKELREARMQAISGVPNFTIGNKYQLSGAQDPALFERVFEELAA